MPGQILNRQQLFEHNGHLYTLMFFPDEPITGPVYEQIDTLDDLPLRSFIFLAQ